MNLFTAIPYCIDECALMEKVASLTQGMSREAATITWNREARKAVAKAKKSMSADAWAQEMEQMRELFADASIS